MELVRVSRSPPVWKKKKVQVEMICWPLLHNPRMQGTSHTPHTVKAAVSTLHTVLRNVEGEGSHWSLVDSFYFVLWTVDPFATKLGLIVNHHKLESWKNWITVFKVKVTVKIQNVNECVFGQYILNCWTFCNQTWYRDALSWARVKIGLLS